MMDADDFVQTLRGAGLSPEALESVRARVLHTGGAVGPHRHYALLQSIALSCLVGAIALPQAVAGSPRGGMKVDTPALSPEAPVAPPPIAAPAGLAAPRALAAPAGLAAPRALAAPRSVAPALAGAPGIAARGHHAPAPAGPRGIDPPAIAALPVADAARLALRAERGEPAAPAGAPKVGDPRFDLALALRAEGLAHAAALVLDAIAREGSEHPDFGRALPELAAIAGDIPDPDFVTPSVARYGRTELARFGAGMTRNDYDHVLLMLGRDRYDAADVSGAIALLREIRRGSDHYVPAKLLEGVSHVRQRHARPAVAAFRAAIDAIEDGDAGDLDDADVKRDLAWLSLGRLYYTVAMKSRGGGPVDARILGNAIAAWDRIPESSEHWLDAMFEEAWALYVSGQHDRALGRIHALESPYFEARHYPEARVLRAVILFSHCQLDASEDVVGAFHRRYDPLRDALDHTLDAYDDNVRAHGLARSLARNDAGLDPRLAALLRHAVEDREIGRGLAGTTAMSRELRTLPAVAARRPEIAAHLDWLLAELTVAQALAVDRTGELVRQRIRRVQDDLQDQMNAMDTVELEIQTDLRRRPAGYPPGDDGIRIVADQEHVVWPFDGEYWEDELPYYRVQVPDRCTR